MTSNAGILIVTREHLLGALLREVLSTCHYQSVTETSSKTALDRFIAERPALTVVDLASLGQEGLDLICDARLADADAAIVAVVGQMASSLESTVYSFGVTDVVRRDEDMRQVLELAEHARASGSVAEPAETEASQPGRAVERPVLDEPTTVLVVDDDSGARRLLERILTRDGYRVLTSSDGVEALEVLSREPVDLMLLDLQLPRLGGLAVLRRVRDLESPPRIVIISGLADRDLKLKTIGLGAFDYLQKPLSVERVRVTVSAALALERARGRRSFWKQWTRRFR